MEKHCFPRGGLRGPDAPVAEHKVTSDRFGAVPLLLCVTEEGGHTRHQRIELVAFFHIED